jgi:hypothetical protein
LTILSRAGRFASGKSVGAEGEEGSSRGLLVEGIAVVEDGDADMSHDLRQGIGRMLFLVEFVLFDSELLCTPGVSKENVLVQEGFGNAKC